MGQTIGRLAGLLVFLALLGCATTPTTAPPTATTSQTTAEMIQSTPETESAIPSPLPTKAREHETDSTTPTFPQSTAASEVESKQDVVQLALPPPPALNQSNSEVDGAEINLRKHRADLMRMSCWELKLEHKAMEDLHASLAIKRNQSLCS